MTPSYFNFSLISHIKFYFIFQLNVNACEITLWKIFAFVFACCSWVGDNSQSACQIGGRVSMKKALLYHTLGCLFVFIENMNRKKNVFNNISLGYIYFMQFKCNGDKVKNRFDLRYPHEIGWGIWKGIYWRFNV